MEDVRRFLSMGGTEAVEGDLRLVDEEGAGGDGGGADARGAVVAVVEATGASWGGSPAWVLGDQGIAKRLVSTESVVEGGVDGGCFTSSFVSSSTMGLGEVTFLFVPSVTGAAGSTLAGSAFIATVGGGGVDSDVASAAGGGEVVVVVVAGPLVAGGDIFPMVWYSIV